jgi:hypothetical protein
MGRCPEDVVMRYLPYVTPPATAFPAAIAPLVIGVLSSDLRIPHGDWLDTLRKRLR